MEQKLTFNELVKKLGKQNISTGTFTEEEVNIYLRETCYYNKITSYRNNYPKSPQGGYVSLTFNHLVATARLDRQLREYLLHLCLDVEHTTRTKLMAQLTYSKNENGYQIVQEFNLHYKDWYQRIIKQYKRNRYRTDKLHQSDNIPVWTFLEIVDYGALIRLMELFADRNPYSAKGLYLQQHMFIKNIRNTCAHNDVFLADLFNRDSWIKQPNQQSISYAHSINISSTLIHYRKINDLVNLFYIHSQISSRQLKQIRHTEGLKILDRFQSELNYFKDSNSLTKFFSSVLPLLIDFLNQSS